MKAVILAGGGGTRLWPLSTAEKPKQFQKLISDKTMLEETVERLNFLEPSDIYIAINKDHIGLVKDLCPQIPAANIIIEPALRDTASCIGLATAIIELRHPGEVMAVIYADHLIKNHQEFATKLKLAEKIALEQNTLNIVEVEATEPNTNYGYVKVAPNGEIFDLVEFVEKPDLETARKFVSSSEYLWNTGIYVWKAANLLEQFAKLKPETYEKLMQIQESYDSENGAKILNEIYPTLEKISVDYAIMEKVDPSMVKIIKADLRWSDVGNWEAIWSELSSKSTENIERGDVKSIDCEGCLIYAENGTKIAAIGMKDTIIVDTKEGLLVCQKDQSKKVKDLRGI